MRENVGGSVVELDLKTLNLNRRGTFSRTRAALAADRGAIDSYFRCASSDIDVGAFTYTVDEKELCPPC